MTKKLSKQLCKICNIPFERHIDNCRVVDNDGDLCEQYVEILDFGQPENFVRLEEIMLTELAKHHLTVVKWVRHWSDNTLMYEYILIQKTGHKFRFDHNGIKIDNWFVERTDRTECLILFVQWKVIPICGESIKQVIREAEWVYDR